MALCSKELCSTWSFRLFEMVVSSSDQQQGRRHSAEIVKLLVPQDKNEAFRSRLGYRNLRLYDGRGLIQISRGRSLVDSITFVTCFGLSFVGFDIAI